MQAIINGKLILPHSVEEKHILVFNDTIQAIEEADKFQSENYDRVYDAQGNYVAPGFFNIHIHGIKGADAMDEDQTSISRMAEALPATGVTDFLPTTMTYDFSRIATALTNIRQGQYRELGAIVRGANLEGPFISPQYKGAQAEKNIQKADFSLLGPFKDVIKIITLAPETLTDTSFIETCADNDIIVSLGHSAATYEQALDALRAGASHITHLFNAMSPLHHRAPGLVGVGLDTHVKCELIADNIHIHPAVQRLVFKAKAPENIILITDSMRACLLGDCESELGGQKVYVKKGKATLADGSMAGSVAPMNQVVANFKTNTRADWSTVINMVTLNPATEFGLDHQIGSLEPKKLANITIFDENCHIKQTFIKGQSVFKS